MLPLALLLAPPPVRPEAVPPVPAGTSPEFHAAVLEVKRATVAKDFARATRLLARVPDARRFAYRWDDAGTPADLRQPFAAARDVAFREWSQMDGPPVFTPSKTPAVVFSFAPKLAEGAGVAVLPRAGGGTDVVIGLRRGADDRPATPADVAADVRYAVGRVFGLGDAAMPSSAMSRLVHPDGLHVVLPIETWTLARMREMRAALARAVAARRVLTGGAPEATFDVVARDGGRAVQGDVVPFVYQLTNTGTGPLVYRTVGDCGCILAAPAGTLPPGGVALLTARFETAKFAGEQRRKLVVVTNDPERISRALDIRLDVRPRYRFLGLPGSTLYLDEGDRGELFLDVPGERPLKFGAARVIGLKGTASLIPGEAVLPDPELKESPRPRKGYRVPFTVDPSVLLPGRSEMQIEIPTDDPGFPTIRHTVYVQRGIVALPDEVYLGLLGAKEVTTDVLLSRPGRTFEVKTAESDSPRVAAKPVRGPDGQWRVRLTYLGGAPSGELAGTVTVTTDDAKQPTLRVPFRGLVP